MSLELIQTNDNNGKITEVYKTNDKKITKVTVTYSGTEQALDNFLTGVILDYARQNRLID